MLHNTFDLSLGRRRVKKRVTVEDMLLKTDLTKEVGKLVPTPESREIACSDFLDQFQNLTRPLQLYMVDKLTLYYRYITDNLTLIGLFANIADKVIRPTLYFKEQ